jgi:ribosomal protein S2
MDTARIVWETFTGGSLTNLKRKERIKQQKLEEERKAREERDKVI